MLIFGLSAYTFSDKKPEGSQAYNNTFERRVHKENKFKKSLFLTSLSSSLFLSNSISKCFQCHNHEAQPIT